MLSSAACLSADGRGGKTLGAPSSDPQRRIQVFHWARFKRRTTTPICWIKVDILAPGYLGLIRCSPRTERSIRKNVASAVSGDLSTRGPACPTAAATTGDEAKVWRSSALHGQDQTSSLKSNHVPRAMDWGAQGCVLRCEIDSSQAMQNVPSIVVLC